MDSYQILFIIKEYQLAGALVGAVVTIVGIYINNRLQQKTNVPAIAIIGKNGSILYKSNFGYFKLHSERKYDNENPYYILTFEKEPDYFEINTQEAAIREINQLEIGKYKITFYKLLKGGFMAPSSEIIQCDFKIQAFKIK